MRSKQHPCKWCGCTLNGFGQYCSKEHRIKHTNLLSDIQTRKSMERAKRLAYTQKHGLLSDGQQRRINRFLNRPT